MTAPAPIDASRPRRRRWPFVASAIVLVVLLVGFFVADAAAKSYAQQRIRTQLISALGLPSSSEVRVDLGGGSILLQALGGSVGTVDVAMPELAFGDLVGSARLRATDVPLDTAQPLGTLGVDYTITQKALSAIAADLSGVELDSITLAAPDIVANATISVFGAGVPVALSLTPSVSDGRLVFTPSNVELAGQSFTAQTLRSSPIFGGLASTLLRQQSFCVAQYLPKALTAKSVTVSGSTLVLAFDGDGAVLGGNDFTAKGSCS